jgi:hypothetical protein
MATVQEAYDALAQLIENGLGDCELCMVTQPNYPLCEMVDGFWYDEEEEADNELKSNPSETTVYVVSGGQRYSDPYAPRQAFEEATLQF